MAQATPGARTQLCVVCGSLTKLDAAPNSGGNYILSFHPKVLRRDLAFPPPCVNPRPESEPSACDPSQVECTHTVRRRIAVQTRMLATLGFSPVNAVQVAIIRQSDGVNVAAWRLLMGPNLIFSVRFGRGRYMIRVTRRQRLGLSGDIYQGPGRIWKQRTDVSRILITN